MLHFSLYIIKRFKDIRNCLLLHSLQITCADHTSGDELSVRQGGPCGCLMMHKERKAQA